MGGRCVSSWVGLCIFIKFWSDSLICGLSLIALTIACISVNFYSTRNEQTQHWRKLVMQQNIPSPKHRYTASWSGKILAGPSYRNNTHKIPMSNNDDSWIPIGDNSEFSTSVLISTMYHQAGSLQYEWISRYYQNPDAINPTLTVTLSSNFTTMCYCCVG